MAHRREEANVEEPRAFAVQPRDAHVSRRRAVAGLHGDTAGVGGQGGDQSAEARWAGSKGDQRGLPKAEESKVGFEGTLKNEKQRGWGEGGGGRGGRGCQRQPQRHAPPRPPPPLASNRRVGCRAGGGGGGRPRRVADAEPTLPRPPTRRRPSNGHPCTGQRSKKQRIEGTRGWRWWAGRREEEGGGGKSSLSRRRGCKGGKVGRSRAAAPRRVMSGTAGTAQGRGAGTAAAPLQEVGNRGRRRRGPRAAARVRDGQRARGGHGRCGWRVRWRGRRRCTPGLHPPVRRPPARTWRPRLQAPGGPHVRVLPVCTPLARGYAK